MSLHKVPGSKRYKADSSGLKELGRAAWMSSQVVSSAQRIAAAANAAGEGSYEAVPRLMRAGWDNQERAGAVVRVVTPAWRDTRDQVLAQVARSMAVRGGE